MTSSGVHLGDLETSQGWRRSIEWLKVEFEIQRPENQLHDTNCHRFGNFPRNGRMIGS